MDQVVAIDLTEHNTVLVGHDRFFVFRADGQVQLVRDSCPHRGGPLSLARLTPDGRRLSCPWHGTKVGVAALRRTAQPMVRTGERAVIVLSGFPLGAPVSVIRRRILANQPPAECPDNGLATSYDNAIPAVGPGPPAGGIAIPAVEPASTAAGNGSMPVVPQQEGARAGALN